jgi:LacI family transcriptional regulator
MKKNHLTVSLITPYYHNMFSTFYTLEIIKEVSKAAIEFDVNLLIETTYRMPSISGILFADLMGNELLAKKVRAKKMPYLILNYYNPEAKDSCIGIDNEKASFEAVNYLIESGHNRIATITGKLSAQAGIQRLGGFKNALKKNNIGIDDRYIINGDWTKESGKGAMEKLLLLKNKLPSAVFVAGDEMAIGAMETVKEAGLKVPGDISFVGFDNIPEASAPEVSLTTVEQPFSDMAKLGIKYLIQVIKNKPKQPVRVLLDNTKLIKRTSVKNLVK